MLRLYIGNKNYSSWSMRPWLAMRHAGIVFEELTIALFEDGYKQRISAISPSGRVPCLVDGEITVWDSLAILEYLADSRSDLWPADAAPRARARSACAEMHSGFSALRDAMPMNLRARLPGRGRRPEVAADIRRMVALWTECRRRDGAGGPFLFGRFSNADAMFAPVVWRFLTYSVEVDTAEARNWMNTMRGLPAMQQWLADAQTEPHAIDAYDNVA